MATLDSNNPTLLDFAKSIDPSGKTARIIEILNQENAILEDMSWMEGNLPTGHRTTVRAGLAASYWRMINMGTPESTTSEVQVDEAVGMLVSRSSVDKDLAALNGNTTSFRFSRSKGHLEGMAQEVAQTLFYGNSGANPEEFTGLSVRYSDTTAANGQNILLAGGAGSDNSSVWLIVHGPETVQGIFPKGMKAGLVHDDLGLGDAFDSNNNRFRAYMDEYTWKVGISVMDWRYAVRIPNIDISALVSKTSAADLIELMIKAIHRIPSLAKGRASFYMNRTCLQMLDIQKRDDVISGGGLVYKDVDGRPVTSFRGIPVRLCDQLVETEALVS